MSMKPSASKQDLWFAGGELSQVVEQGDCNMAATGGKIKRGKTGLGLLRV